MKYFFRMMGWMFSKLRKAVGPFFNYFFRIIYWNFVALLTVCWLAGFFLWHLKKPKLKYTDNHFLEMDYFLMRGTHDREIESNRNFMGASLIMIVTLILLVWSVLTYAPPGC